MTHKVILFGSIGTLINTSNLQRCAFNQAFPNEDLDWNWKPEDYQKLLTKPRGCERIKKFAIQPGIDALANL